MAPTRRAALIVTAVLAALVVVGTPRAAGACSCALTDDAAAFARADAVFVGRLVDIQVQAGDTFTSTDPQRWIFEVERVYRGEVFATQSIVSARDGASCGLELGPVGGRFVVFANASGTGFVRGGIEGEYYANLCGGSRAVAGGDDAVPASLATPSPPKAGSSPVGTFTAARETTSTTDRPGPLDVASPPTSPTWNWVAFLVAIALAVVAVVAIRRRARSTSP